MLKMHCYYPTKSNVVKRARYFVERGADKVLDAWESKTHKKLKFGNEITMSKIQSPYCVIINLHFIPRR